VAYSWALKDVGRLGWIAAFIYCAGAALRLARFNSSDEVTDKRFFQGLPSPAAAALVAGFVWIMTNTNPDSAGNRWGSCAMLVFAGITMVSNIRYYSFKDFNLRRSVPFVVVVAIALAIALLSYEPSVALFSLFVVYALSGYALALSRRLTRRSPIRSD